MSPSIAHLPADVLLEICLYTVQDQCFRMNRTSSPWNISRVCSHWRNVSLGYARLWAKFCIIADGSYNRDALSTALQRSRAYPLTFAFYFDKLQRRELALAAILERPHPRHDLQVQSALQTIAGESHRWKTALFSLPVSVHQSFLASQLITDVGILENLTLEKPLSSLEEAQEPLPPFDTFRAAHKLSRVTLKVEMLLNLPWNNLRSFHAHYIHLRSLRYLARIPSRCPNLESFDAIFDGPETPFHYQPILFRRGREHTHTNLKHLSVQNNGFLHEITLPALEWLSVSILHQARGLLGSLFQRSRCHNLRYLNVTHVQSPDFMHIIENASTVETLSLTVYCRDPVESFRSLAFNDHLLPRLNVLKLVIVARGAVPPRNSANWHIAEVETMATVMRAFLRNRKMDKVEVGRRHGECKQRVPRAQWVRPTGDLAMLQELRNSGLDLRLRMCGHNYLTSDGLNTSQTRS
ncbi:hypothetical protein CPB85DRAFT_1442101 [Mucidula mucida]|nr:hypothetical protein CPB85DRAFT_1442101 [Mucidula mucida]